MTKSEFELIARLLRSKEPVISAVRMVIFEQVRFWLARAIWRLSRSF